MGYTAFQNMAREDMPPFTIRAASVVTSFPGASPERVETMVTERVEKKLQDIPEIDFITSESRTGLSVVTIHIKESVFDLQPIWDKVRRKVEAIQFADGIRDPEVKDDGVGDVYGIAIGLEADGFSTIELEDYADKIKEELIRFSDIANVEIQGVREEQIHIEFDNARLSEMGLSAGQIQNMLSATNILFSGGKINFGKQQIILEPSGNFESIEQLENFKVLSGRSNHVVRLGDITTITKRLKTPAENLVRINAMQGVVLSISIKEGANIIRSGEVVDKLIEQYNNTLPHGISVLRVASNDIEVDVAVSDFVVNLLQSIGIVLIVMLLFLGVRTGLIVSSLIPTTMVSSFFLLGIFDIGLNKVSLAGLIMALGMLVDNAIVMAESIMVKMEKGTSALDACIESANELRIPLFTSSLTTSASFMAFYVAESTMGEIVGPLFIVITIALLCSWFFSLTVIPLFSVKFLKIQVKEDEEKGFFVLLTHLYERFLGKCIKYPIITVMIIIGIFIGSLQLFPTIPFIFVPDSERNLVTVDINLPQDTRIEITEEKVAMIETFIQDSLKVNDSRTQGVLDWTSFIGKGPKSYSLGYQPGEANSGYAHILVNTSSGDDNGMVIQRIESYIFNNLPDIDYKVERLSQGGGGGYPVEIRIFGEKADHIYVVAQAVKEKLRKIPGSKNVGDTWGLKNLKLKIEIDQDKAQLEGFSNQDVALSLQSLLTGYKIGEYRAEEDVLDIQMQSDQWDMTLQQLKAVNVYVQNSGKSIPLSQIAEVREVWEFPKIMRRDLIRMIAATSYLQDGYTANDITAQILPWLEKEKQSWPRGVSYAIGGELENAEKGMVSIAEKLPMSGFIILLLLILQFNSIRRTCIILSTIPLGITGVILGLLVTNSYFSFYGFLGVISLAGIVINNAIVLLDRAAIEKENGKSHFESIKDAAIQRFRPIILTTATTICGLIPLWLGGGLLWEPMAIGLIFGLSFATLITLVMVPCLYCTLFRAKAQ